MSRTSNILYDPSLSVKENVAMNAKRGVNVTESGMYYYIRTHNVDRNQEKAERIVADIRKALEADPSLSQAKVADQTGYCISTVNKYWKVAKNEKALTPTKELRSVSRTNEKELKAIESIDPTTIYDILEVEDFSTKLYIPFTTSRVFEHTHNGHSISTKNSSLSDIIGCPPSSELTSEVLDSLMSSAHRTLALLMPASALSEKYEQLFRDHRPSRVYIYTNSIGVGATSLNGYAWYVWEKGNDKTELKWISKKDVAIPIDDSATSCTTKEDKTTDPNPSVPTQKKKDSDNGSLVSSILNLFKNIGHPSPLKIVRRPKKTIDVDNSKSEEKVYGVIGSVIGDIVGSKLSSSKFQHNSRAYRFSLLTNDNYFTDDTVETIAIADAMVSGEDFGAALIKWCKLYPLSIGYGHKMKEWLKKGDSQNKLNSSGNGAAMRVSSIGFLAKNIDEALGKAKASAMPTHGTVDGIAGAQAIAAAIYLARQKKSKEDIKKYVEKKFKYNLDLNDEQLRELVYNGGQASALAINTVPLAIIAFLEGDCYEDVVRVAATYMGFSDTICNMAGAIAAAYYGVPMRLVQQALRYLDDQQIEVINKVDHTTLSSHITPPTSKGWRKNSIIVYGAQSTLQGKGEDGSYEVNALRRKGYPIRTINADFDSQTKVDIDNFKTYVNEHPEKIFLVKKIGIDSAGIKVEDIAPLFKELRGKANVYLPLEYINHYQNSAEQ